jgi:hypothetical protein
MKEIGGRLIANKGNKTLGVILLNAKAITNAYWGLYNWPHTNSGCWNIQISTLKYQ